MTSETTLNIISNLVNEVASIRAQLDQEAYDHGHSLAKAAIKRRHELRITTYVVPAPQNIVSLKESVPRLLAYCGCGWILDTDSGQTATDAYQEHLP